MKKLILCSLIVFISVSLILWSQDEVQENSKKEEAIPLETTNLARQRLDDLLKLHGLFNAKMSAPEFGDFISGKIMLWKKNNRLKVPADLQWSKMKNDMNQLGSQLALIRADKSFLDQLRKDHVAYKAIQAFQKSLEGIMKFPIEAKRKAFIPLLNAYAHQLYTNNLLEKTNAILAKGSPEKETDQGYQEPAPTYDFDSSFDIEFSTYSFEPGSFDGGGLGDSGDFEFDFDDDFY